MDRTGEGGDTVADQFRELVELRREADRLRTENARLSRLLELRGQDTSPAPEQLAAASPQGPVTMASPASAKVALFMDVFHARTDTYAIRWENSRRGTKGWVPAVAGGWRKGMRWSQARRLELTRAVVADHLTDSRLFIGLYPMTPANTSRFVVADFDGPTAMLDALAYVKAARSSGVPAALEISQSGKGAHVWIIFTDDVPGATARSVATTFIHEATVLRGAMDLRSYDRLFPAQDVLPGDTPGNLIAAPLQGQRRKDGLTLFLDPGTLEPFDDQWDFLSTLGRLTPREAARIARKATRAVVGHEVGRLSRSEATKVHPRLATVVHAELAAGLALDAGELPPAALSTFKHAASMANPKFYELQRLRKSTWNVARFVTGYDITTDDKLVLPRGLRHTVAQIVQRAGSRLDVTDNREAGSEVDVALTADLTDRQAAAVSAMLAHDDGVLVAPPGSGKTVMACAVIAERAASTLILVDRKALAEQWRTRIKDFLDIKAGQLGGGRSKLTGVVDIAMLPTLARRDDVAELAARYGHVVVDEAHHIAAAAYDHSVKAISARYWLGLTATPDRRDGLGELMTWQLGPVRHTMTDPEPGTLAEAAELGSGPERVLHVHETDFHHEVDPDAASPIADVNRALTLDEARNIQIVGDVAAAVARGRNCLVLTRRVAHLEALSTMLAEGGHKVVSLQGGMTTKARRAAVDVLADAKAGDGVLVIGTTPFIGEGFDAPALDTLFLAAPVSFDGLLIQCAGRIVRAAPGKDTAEVHDYHDHLVPLLAVSLRRRMPGYTALRFDRR